MIPIKEIQSVVFLGSGNVATHLATAMQQAELNILQIYSPNVAHAKSLAHKTKSEAVHDISNINPDADLYLISVTDDHLREVAEKLPLVGGLVAHTSGIVEMKALENFEFYGVFYPLQTFSKTHTLELESVPFCIEGNHEAAWKPLFKLAQKLSRSVHYVNSPDRKQIHLAAVFVNNFTNHLYAAAEELLEDKNLNFELLLPLLQETAAKLDHLQPGDAQTGPARRNDVNTIKTHSEMLKDKPELLEIYQLFSHQILNKYHDKL